MNAELLEKRLLEASLDRDDFPYILDKIADELPEGDSDIGLVDAILRFMEENPGLDYGGRGALMHFVEKFHRRGYEDLLIASIERRPTSETMVMLIRLINGTKDRAAREKLLLLVKNVLDRHVGDEATQWLAKDCLAAEGLS